MGLVAFFWNCIILDKPCGIKQLQSRDGHWGSHPFPGKAIPPWQGEDACAGSVGENWPWPGDISSEPPWVMSICTWIKDSFWCGCYLDRGNGTTLITASDREGFFILLRSPFLVVNFAIWNPQAGSALSQIYLVPNQQTAEINSTCWNSRSCCFPWYRTTRVFL